MNKPGIHISIIRGIDGRWSYCPRYAISLLKPAFVEGQYDTKVQAVTAARADKSVPAGSHFDI